MHEAGHQFWYGLVATNEFENAWMDEGINTFSTARGHRAVLPAELLAKRYFGGFVPWAFEDFPLAPRDRRQSDRRLSRGGRTPRCRRTPSYRYWPGTAGSITYNKTALWLNTLERLIGWDTLQRVPGDLLLALQFRHPGPEDFFAVANEVSGRDLTWFFDQVYRELGGVRLRHRRVHRAVRS